MAADTGNSGGSRGSLIVIFVATVIVIVVAVVGYHLVSKERQRADESQRRAEEATARADEAKTTALETAAAAKAVGNEAAPELVDRANASLRRQQWEEAAQAAEAAVKLAPKLGAAWLSKGRVLLQAEQLKEAAAAFAKSLDDDTMELNMQSRASQLQRVCLDFERQREATGQLTMPQYIELGRNLRYMGEIDLASWFLRKGGEQLEAVRMQVEAAQAQLKQDNPKLAKFLPPIVKANEVTWNLNYHPELTDISALAGLPLTSLDIHSTGVASLSPLEGMPLRELLAARTPVTDLSPLKGMPLHTLYVSGDATTDLAPLAGAPLEVLMTNVVVRDLSLLKGMPLKSLAIRCKSPDLEVLRDMPLEMLNLQDATELSDASALRSLKQLTRLLMFSSPISDLSVLENSPIERLDLMDCHQALDLAPLAKLATLRRLNLGQVPERTDISGLAGLKLNDLTLDRCSISDISALKGMPLRLLNIISYGPIVDYSPLQGMELRELAVGYLAMRYDQSFWLLPDTLGFLKDMKSLKTLKFGVRDKGDLATYDRILDVAKALKAANPDYQSGAFYRLENGAVTEVWLSRCPIGDLSPLKGLALTRIIAEGAPIADLSPLKGMPLTVLDVAGTKVSDLSPVAGAPLEVLNLTGSKVTDYGQLKAMALQHITLDDNAPAAAWELLRGMETLTTINGQPVAEFWKARDNK